MFTNRALLLSTVQITMCIQQVRYALVIIQIGAARFTLFIFCPFHYRTSCVCCFILPSERDEVKWKTEKLFIRRGEENYKKPGGKQNSKRSFALTKIQTLLFVVGFYFRYNNHSSGVFCVTIIIFGNWYEKRWKFFLQSFCVTARSQEILRKYYKNNKNLFYVTGRFEVTWKIFDRARYSSSNKKHTTHIEAFYTEMHWSGNSRRNTEKKTTVQATHKKKLWRDVRLVVDGKEVKSFRGEQQK